MPSVHSPSQQPAAAGDRSRTSWHVRLALVLAVSLLGYGYWSAEVQQRTAQNVILITIDTLRADRLGSYGYAKARTPALDAFAAAGTQFDVAYCDVPWTTGSMASVMTGLLSPSHGVRRPWNRLATDQTTLAEVLKDQGFRTGAVVGSFPLDSVYGLDQGFQSYDDTVTTPMIHADSDRTVERVEAVVAQSGTEERVFWNDADAKPNTDPDRLFGAKLTNDSYRPDNEVTDAAIGWLAQKDAGRFFLWVHYFGPHEKFAKGNASRQHQVILDAYDPDVAAVDQEIGRLLAYTDGLGVGGSSLVIVHSDHGQALGEHGRFGHGQDLNEPAMRVPLLMRFPPAVAAGRRSDRTVRNVDLLPTILDYAGVDWRGRTDGESVREALDNFSAPARPAFMELTSGPPVVVSVAGVGEVFGRAHWLGVRQGSWKYMRTALTGPCVVSPTGYIWGLLGVNRQSALGGREASDTECTSLHAEYLFDVANVEAGLLQSETRNLLEEHPETAAILRKYATSFAQQGRKEETRLKLSEDQQGQLRSLGYLN